MGLRKLSARWDGWEGVVLRNISYIKKGGWQYNRLLRQATDKQPVVCILDQFDHADPRLLTTFLIGSMGELLPGRRLSIVASIDGPPALPTTGAPTDQEEPPAHFAARSLIRRSLAHWLPLPPMRQDEVAAWLRDAEPALVQHLHTITDGNPAWLVHLWDELWTQEKVQPHPKTYRWTPAPGYQLAALGTINDIFGQRLQHLFPDPSPATFTAAFGDTLALLYCASLEGRIFTAQAIAHALDQEADDFIDFLDDHLARSEDQPYGLIQELDSIPITDGQEVRTLWSYTFASDLFWYTLQQFHQDPSLQAQRCARLAAGLEAVYAPQERNIAHTLARLHAAAGNQQQAYHYRWMAHNQAQAQATYVQARLLMQIDKSGWSALEQGWVARQLNEAAETICLTHPFQDTLDIASAAHSAALLANLPGEQARAFNLLGVTCRLLGEMRRALGYYEQALTLIRQVGDQAKAAATLTNIGIAYKALGERQKSLGYLEQALTILRRTKQRAWEAVTLVSIGQIYADLGDIQKALNYYAQALPTLRQEGEQIWEAATLHSIGAAYAALGENASALDYAEQALLLSRQMGNHSGEATTLASIGPVYYVLGEKDKARQTLERALVLQIQLGDRFDEIDTRWRLATLHQGNGNLAQAIAELEKALAMASEVHSPDTAAIAQQLAQLRAAQ